MRCAAYNELWQPFNRPQVRLARRLMRRQVQLRRRITRLLLRRAWGTSWRRLRVKVCVWVVRSLRRRIWWGVRRGDSVDVDAKFQQLLATVHENRPGDDLEIIRKAWAFCLQQHEGQKRASGEPYIIHPLEVGQVLAELKMDSTAIAAGLLHDAVEDTDVTSAEIAKQFGDQVAHIVEGVTKLEKIKFANREDHQAENIRKMLLAMVTDVRVVIIKLADRLHNMRTLEHLKPEKQQKIARETLDIYAPLAHRLGMGKLRGELEDLAFRYTDPYAYEQVSTEVDALRGAGEEFLQKIVTQLEAKLKEFKIQGRVESRIKRLYSIQQKLQDQKIPVDQVYDLLAIRVICRLGAGLLCAAGAAA